MIRTHLRLLALLVAAASACGGDSGIDALVVVQETNVPDDPPPCPDHEHDYTVEVVTECDQGTREVHVCSDEALCDAQIEAAVAAIRTCDEFTGYETEIPPDCD